MPVFDILCLANSNKMRGSCIAGLRLDGGGWIRPVAGTPHGELYPDHYILQDGSCPRLFDRIRISFTERKPLSHQPENWLIADQPWQLVSRGLSPEFAALLESHLIAGPALLGNFSRKISFERFEREPAMSSLCLIRPGNLRWTIEHLPYNAHKASALFRLGGTSFRLPVTDPARLDAFRALPPDQYPFTACGIAAGVEVLLTISLGDPWEDGCCYKMAAGILALEPDSIAVPAKAIRTPVSLYPAMVLSFIRTRTVKALRAAAAALRSGPSRKKPRELPQAGKAWDTAEEEILVREFEGGETMAAIARAHGRTPGAIKVRLIRLGKIAG